MSIRFTHFPRTSEPPEFVRDIFAIFVKHENDISTKAGNTHDSDRVLAELRDDLMALGYDVESGKKKHQKIHRPVTFGENGISDLKYEIDAFHEGLGVGIEVEAGRGHAGNAIYRDLVQGIVMNGVDHLVIAVCNHYHSNGSDDYSKCLSICEGFFIQNRVKLPYTLTLIGY